MSAADNVTPIRDLHSEMNDIVEDLYAIRSDIPADGLEEGYLLSAQTQQDLRRAIAQLREAFRILEHARDYEDPIYNAYCNAREPEEEAR
jgi:hypothetical protein